MFDDPETILLSPLEGGEDEGEGVKCARIALTLTLSPQRGKGAKKGGCRTSCEGGFLAPWAK